MGEVIEGLSKKKKRKHGGTSVNGVDEVVVDVGMNVTKDNGSGKKKKKDKSRLRGDDKKEKNKSNEADNAAGATDVGSVEKQIGDEATDKLHSVNNKKRKDKVYGVNDNGVNGADNAAATDAGSVGKQIGDEATEKLHSVKNKKRKDKVYGVNGADDATATDAGSVGKHIGDEATEKLHSVKNKKLKDMVYGVNENVLNGADNAAATDAGSVGKQIGDEATEKLHFVKNKKRKDKVYGVNENGVNGADNAAATDAGSVGKHIGDEATEKLHSVKNKKLKDMVYGVNENGLNEADNAAANDVGSVEKQIGDEATDKLHSVKNKKRKDRVYGVNENDEPIKDNKRTSKDDVLVDTDKVEGHKKKKNSGAGSLVEDQINNGTTEQVEAIMDDKRTKTKEGDFGDADGKGGSQDGASKKRKKKSIATDEKVNADGKGDSQDGASKKRKKKSLATDEKVNADAAGGSVTNEGDVPTDSPETSNARKKSKKVKFNDTVEVFSLPNDSIQWKKISEDGSKKKISDDGSKKKNSEDGLLQGKRFSKEEDEIIRKAVLQYIEDHQLGEEGLNMVLRCSQHKELKDCWKEIAEALPLRNKTAVYCRAHILFERSESRKWTKEELEEVRKYHEKYGPKWRDLADEIGRNRVHVKDAYRQVKLANKKNGQWSQEEYQNLFNLVNKDLRIRAFMDRKSKHGMLRDNIGWEAISEELTTRTDPVCCMKWYNQLSSKLVACGLWADTDDYRLLMALSDIDATCEEDVDWENLVEERSGSVCRKRWSEMVRHIGKHGIKSFSEQVEILSQRYCEDVVEARETYDNKPFVD